MTIKLSWSALSAQVGDKIYDKRANKIGTVVKEGQSGNYTILHVDFGGKHPRRINPMDDAQITQRYFRVLRSYFKVPKAVTKKIKTSEDLSDFYAYCERSYEMEEGEDEESYLDRIPTYSWPVDEQERVSNLEPNYVAGYYNKDNVKRIMGKYYNKENPFLKEE